MKNLHIFPDSLFSKSYIRLITENFNPDDHHFITFSLHRKPINGYDNIKSVTVLSYPQDLSVLYSNLKKADTVFLHGLSSHKIVRYLFPHISITKKCHWVIWGADLYYYRTRTRSIYSFLYEKIRKRVIKNFRSIISYTPADIKLVKSIYKFPGDVNTCFYYPGALLAEKSITPEFYTSQKIQTKILVGNSATPTNNHEEIFFKLSQLEDKDFIVYCPLSYGDMAYGEKISQLGNQLFGARFKPLKELLPLEEYFNLLNSIDISIFDFSRQQGIGNILIMLRLGKKVFVRDLSPVSELLINYGFSFYNSVTIDNNMFIPLNAETARQNNEAVEKYFSEQSSINQWKTIFEKYSR